MTTHSLAGSRPFAAAAGLAAALGARLAPLGRRLAAERARWVLWLPVALGAGIGVYFELPREPPVWPAAALAVLAGIAAFLCRRSVAGLALASGLFAFALGLATAKLHSDRATAPILKDRIGPVLVRGRVLEVEPTAKGPRAVIAVTELGRLKAGERPARIRINLGKEGGAIAAGDRIAARMILMPPPAPAAPGAYDFQRQAWFQRIGAVGFVLGAPLEVARPESGRFAPGEWLERQRQHITARIMAALDPPLGALAAAQITGHRGAIPADILQAMQDSGLAHLLAISGMNIGIVAGLLFFLVRFGLALVPAIALRHPIKKWAAIVAMTGALIYVLISGASVPTQRAWFMFALVMIGILIDREALSMRLCALAAAVILLAAPEALMGASFQMSFAAVVALIACYERYARRSPSAKPPPGAAGTVWRWVWALALTSLVAGLATAPYGIYSFHRVTVYGLAANMIAVPVTDLWVMPWGLAAMLLMPFGLEAMPLKIMGWGIEIVNGVAREVASWPGAALGTTALPGWGLLVFSLGGVWLCLWQARWRWWGAPVMVAGLASMLLVRAPDILVSADNGAVALRGAEGGFLLSAAAGRTYQRDHWQRRDGGTVLTAWPNHGASADGRLVCDGQACQYRPSSNGTPIAILRDIQALAEECGRTPLLIAPNHAAIRCPAAALILDRTALRRNGTHALWLDGAAYRIETDRGIRGERPWVRPAPMR